MTTTIGASTNHRRCRGGGSWPDATVEAILKTLPDAGVAHFSCHGEIDATLLHTGVLLVADRRRLTVQHLDNSPTLSARLAFLSACASGMTAQGVAQLTSVPSLLIAAGAAAVIATFWHTDEMATLLVVSRFYDLWQDGSRRGPADALGQAQAWLATSPASELRAAVSAAALETAAGRHLASCPDADLPFSHPWFWAPYFLLGA
jgi:CHAT domain-containing protein